MSKFLLTCLAVFVSVFALSAQQDKRMVITIDDLPNSTIAKDDSVIYALNMDILKALQKWQVTSVGFVNEIKLLDIDGNLSPIRQSILEKWLETNQELGNHTYSHPDYNVTDPEAYFEDIEQGEKVIKPLIAKYGKQLRYFRHPFLHRGDTKEKVLALETYLQSKGYVEAPVTVDNADYIFARAYEITLRKGDNEMAKTIGNSYLSYMMEKIQYFERQSDLLLGRQMSQILLLHANLLNADYLNQLLERIQSAGYGFVTLEDALKDSAYAMEDKYVTRSGISWIHRWAITQGKDSSMYKGEPACPQYVQKIAGIFE